MAIGDPIPRGDISQLRDDADTRTTDRAVAAGTSTSSQGASDAVESLYAEIEMLRQSVMKVQMEAAHHVRAVVRNRPLSSIAVAFAVGYIASLLTQQQHKSHRRRFS